MIRLILQKRESFPGHLNFCGNLELVKCTGNAPVHHDTEIASGHEKCVKELGLPL